MDKGEKVKIFGVATIVEKDGKILMIQEKQNISQIGKEKAIYTYPSETVKAKEDVFTAAVRGYKEEVGLEVELKNVIGFYDIKGGFGISFLGKLIGNEQVKLNTEELLNYKWMSESEIKEIEYLRPGIRESLEDFYKGIRYPLSIIKLIK